MNCLEMKVYLLRRRTGAGSRELERLKQSLEISQPLQPDDHGFLSSFQHALGIFASPTNRAESRELERLKRSLEISQREVEERESNQKKLKRGGNRCSHFWRYQHMTSQRC